VRILNVSGGADIAGVSIGIKRAFDACSDWTVHSLVAQTNYIHYPQDLPWKGLIPDIEWRAADVVHLHDGFWSTSRLEHRNGEKPYVVYYHGTQFRYHSKVHLKEQRQRGALGLVSTLDLWLLASNDVEWMPVPVEIERMQGLRAEHYQPSDRIRVAHAPTNRDIKSTDEFLRAVARLRSEGFSVDPVLIEGQTWDTCLRMKANANIFFDQVKLGYGVNALESWAMGIPVIAGAAPDTLVEMGHRFGELPFHVATPDTIYEALREMVGSADLRGEMARRGQRYVEGYHSQGVVVGKLQGVYQQAAGTVGAVAA
jgi:hypothetical protein